MTLATIIFSFVCILLILGYQFDLRKGTVEQGGLVQFRSFPSGAVITLDGKNLNFRTPGKENVETGPHVAKMTRNGYEDWTKTFSIDAGELRWLNYARFVPKQLVTGTARSFESLTASLPSPDRKWIMLQQTTASPSVTLADIRDQTDRKFSEIGIPETVRSVSPEPSSYTLKEWDFGSRYVLVQHTSGTITEFLRLDRTDEENAKNITTQFKLPITDIHFSGTSGNVFFGLESGNIRKFDIQAGTISEPLATGVTSFKLFKADVIAYSSVKDTKQIAGVIVDNKAVVVKTYDQSTPILVDISEYFDNYYLAVSHGTRVEVFKDPSKASTVPAKTFYTTQFSEGVKWLKFSSSGRFVVAGNGNHFVTRDLETAETYTTALPGTSSNPDLPLQWLDDYYLVSDADGSLRISEFDGANQHVINSLVPGFKVTLSENGERLYTITKTDKGYALTAIKMTLN